MDDLSILHDVWAPPEAPTPHARARARAALLARAGAAPGARARSSRAPRRPARLAGAGALAVALAIGVTAVADLAGTGSDGRPGSVVPGLPGAPIASAAVLERAAAAAATRPFTAPRDDQWIYVEDRVTQSDGTTVTQRHWRRADGGGMAWIDERGQLEVQLLEPPRDRPVRPALPLDSYKGLTTLPTDPDALLRWAYAQHMINGDASRDVVVYLMLNHVLRENVLPPELEAAIFRAMKQLPGVTVLDTVDVLGRPALALGLTTSDWLHEELLLDKETYAYRGERSTIVRDATIDPLKAGNATGQVTKGSTVVVARAATAIVDEPGQRR
jgi:hypothetical protein